MFEPGLRIWIQLLCMFKPGMRIWIQLLCMFKPGLRIWIQLLCINTETRKVDVIENLIWSDLSGKKNISGSATLDWADIGFSYIRLRIVHKFTCYTSVLLWLYMYTIRSGSCALPQFTDPATSDRSRVQPSRDKTGSRTYPRNIRFVSYRISTQPNTDPIFFFPKPYLQWESIGNAWVRSKYWSYYEEMTLKEREYYRKINSCRDKESVAS